MGSRTRIIDVRRRADSVGLGFLRNRASSSVRNNFDRRHGGITRHGHKLQKQLALGVGLKTFDLADQGAVLPVLFEDVQISHDCLAIAQDVEHATLGGGGISVRQDLAVESFPGGAMFDEVQSHRVLARSNGIA